MKVIYVAGVYRSLTWNGVWNNIMHARQEARKLWIGGWAVICPHTNTIFMDGDDTDGLFLTGDLEIINRCDAIYMLTNWQKSVGARGEYQRAKELGLEIFYESEEENK